MPIHFTIQIDAYAAMCICVCVCVRLAYRAVNAFRVPLVIKPNGNEDQNRISDKMVHLKIHLLNIAYDLDQVNKKKRTKREQK